MKFYIIYFFYWVYCLIIGPKACHYWVKCPKLLGQDPQLGSGPTIIGSGPTINGPKVVLIGPPTKMYFRNKFSPSSNALGFSLLAYSCDLYIHEGFLSYQFWIQSSYLIMAEQVQILLAIWLFTCIYIRKYIPCPLLVFLIMLLLRFRLRRRSWSSRRFSLRKIPTIAAIYFWTLL